MSNGHALTARSLVERLIRCKAPIGTLPWRTYATQIISEALEAAANVHKGRGLRPESEA